MNLEEIVKLREENAKGQTMDCNEILFRLSNVVLELCNVRNSLNPKGVEEFWLPHFNHNLRNTLKGAINCANAAIKQVEKEMNK